MDQIQSVHRPERTHSDDMPNFVLSTYPTGAFLLNVRTGTSYSVNSDMIESVRRELSTAHARFIERSYTGSRLKQIVLHINNSCNCACKHCYMGKNVSVGLPLQSIANVLKEAADLGTQRVSITGGEPFLREDFADIVNILAALGLRLYPVFTNATLLRKRMSVVRLITQLFDTAFYISLHGLRDSHDAFVGKTGAFDAVVDGIAVLKELGAQVVLNTSLHKRNLAELPRMFKFFKRLQIKRWRLSRPFQAGRWLTEYSKWQISRQEEFAAFKSLITKYRVERPFDLELGRLFKSVDGALVRQSYEPADKICGYFESYLVIWPDGETSACPKLASTPITFGNVETESLQAIWESSAMKSWKQRTIENVMKRSQSCKTCNMVNRCISTFGRGCPANSILAGEGLYGPDRELCDIVRQPNCGWEL